MKLFSSSMNTCVPCSGIVAKVTGWLAEWSSLSHDSDSSDNTHSDVTVMSAAVRMLIVKTI